MGIDMETLAQADLLVHVGKDGVMDWWAGGRPPAEAAGEVADRLEAIAAQIRTSWAVDAAG